MNVLVVSPATPNEQTLQPGINSYTQLATLIASYRGQDNVDYCNINFITDIYGRVLSYPVASTVTRSSVKVPEDDLVALEIISGIEKVFYHRDQPQQLTAEGFVDTTVNTGLLTVGNIPLGTGIYGKYFRTEVDATQDILPSEAIYRIDATGCYPLIDGAHGDLLTYSSLTTNRYVAAAMLAGVRALDEQQLGHLTTLWKMVMSRTNEADKVVTHELAQVLSDYILNHNSTTYISTDLRPLQVLPINAILDKLGYQGIFAVDSYNNIRDRGCVTYNLSEANNYRIGHAQY